MHIEFEDKYLYLYPDNGENLDTSKFLGWRIDRKNARIIVERNLVNEIVLNIFKRKNHAYSLQYAQNLKDYQISDVTKMCSVKNILNRNPMGLGKTVEAIKMMKELNVQNAVVIVPKIIMTQWALQFKEWWPERYDDVVIYTGATTCISNNNIVIINYEKFLNTQTMYKFKSFQWDIVCVDEAHKIKNHKSKRTIAIKSIPSRIRVALTGTPILNRPNDLYSILHFLDPYYSGISYYAFTNYFCKMSDSPWGPKPVGLTKDPFKVEILNKLLDYVSVYNPKNITKGKTRSVVILDMYDEQKHLYKNMVELLLDELPDNASIANGAVLTTRLIQTTSWPGLFIENMTGPKFDYIEDICTDNPNEKFVVYTRFEKTADALYKHLKSKNINAVQLTGKISEEQREFNKNAFINDCTVQVFIGTIAAIGTGTDGLQKVSHICIFIDRDWSPEIMNQCEDRLDRYGQEYPVMSYILECSKTLDQKVGRINVSKADDIRKALYGGEE